MTERDSSDHLLVRAAAGDREALGKLVSSHDDRLARMIRVRMSPRLLGRVGVSDVLQELHVEAIGRFQEYAARREMPFFLWLRFLAFQRIAALYRRHVGAQRRDLRRETRLDAAGRSTASPGMLAAQLAAGTTSPSMAAARHEMERSLRAALEELSDLDREVLCLRHFERLSNAEVARELDIDTSAASKRYIRALARLRDVMGAPGPGSD